MVKIMVGMSYKLIPLTMASSSSSQHLAASAPNPIQPPALRRPKRVARSRMANNFPDIDAAMNAGARAAIDKKMRASLILANGRKVPLVSGSGEATPEGVHYYRMLGVSPPTTYPYEQALLNGKS